MATPLINGRAYDYTQITISFLGVPLAGVTSINYDEDQEKTNNMGTGNRPVSRGHGAIDSTGSIEMSMNDLEALRAASPTNSLLDIPMFDVILVFGHPTAPKTHVLKNVEFKKDGLDGAVGDTDLKKSLDIVLSHVEYR